MSAIPQQQPTEETTLYDDDIVAWAAQQARLLRSGRLSEIDIEHIAEEIDDVGRSEQRELASRVAVLLAHLIKWQFQPQRRGHSWLTTIRTQRNRIDRRLHRTPSLKRALEDDDWWADAWDEALDTATRETGIANLPVACPWSPELVLDANWLPEAVAASAMPRR